MMNFDREQHFEDIYNRYYKRVYKFAYTRLGEKQDAEDITNDVFEIYYSKLDALRTHDSHGGWLLGAAKILIKAYYSRKKKRPQDSISDDFIEIPYEEIFFEEDLWSELEKSFTKDEIRILKDKYEYGYKNKEIADALNISENAVNTRFSRLKTKLRNFFENS